MATILLIEDIEDSRRLAQKILASENHQVLLASNAEEAIDIVKSNAVDMVLLDFGLPDMDGRTLIGILRTQYGLAGIPFIAVTAYPRETAARMAKGYGFDGLVVKPYTVGELMEPLNEFLHN